MATTIQPATRETTKQLVNYRTDGGVAVIRSNYPLSQQSFRLVCRQPDSTDRLIVAPHLGKYAARSSQVDENWSHRI